MLLDGLSGKFAVLVVGVFIETDTQNCELGYELLVMELYIRRKTGPIAPAAPLWSRPGSGYSRRMLFVVRILWNLR